MIVYNVGKVLMAEELELCYTHLCLEQLRVLQIFLNGFAYESDKGKSQCSNNRIMSVEITMSKNAIPQFT